MRVSTALDGREPAPLDVAVGCLVLCLCNGIIPGAVKTAGHQHIVLDEKHSIRGKRDEKVLDRGFQLSELLLIEFLKLHFHIYTNVCAIRRISSSV